MAGQQLEGLALTCFRHGVQQTGRNRTAVCQPVKNIQQNKEQQEVERPSRERKSICRKRSADQYTRAANDAKGLTQGYERAGAPPVCSRRLMGKLK